MPDPDRIPARCSLGASLFLIIGLSACAGLGSDYETPTVTVNSFRAVPSAGVIPDFEIGLHVINPNREALALQGVAYTVRLGGHDVIKGVGHDLPVIEPYGEGDLTLRASANLFAGIRLVSDLMKQPGDSLPYEFEAKLDPGGMHRAVRIRDAGEITLND